MDEAKSPTKVLMRKFRATLRRTKEIDLTVWAADGDAAFKAFKDLPDKEVKEILELVDPEIDVTVFEVKDKDLKPEDGIVTPRGAWLDQAETWKEGDEEFEPVDDPMDALPDSTKATLAAERNGARPLPGFATLHDAMGLDPETGKAKK